MVEKINEINSNFIIHPGEILKDILEERGITKEELSIKSHVNLKHINKIINKKKNISKYFAKKLEEVLNIEAIFWINLQNNYNKTIINYNK